MLTSQVLVTGGAGTLGPRADLPTCGAVSTTSVLRDRAQRQILRTQEVGVAAPAWNGTRAYGTDFPDCARWGGGKSSQVISLTASSLQRSRYKADNAIDELLG